MVGNHESRQQTQNRSKAGCRESVLGMPGSLNPPSDILPPARPYLLNLPKEPHQLGIKYSMPGVLGKPINT